MSYEYTEEHRAAHLEYCSQLVESTKWRLERAQIAYDDLVRSAETLEKQRFYGMANRHKALAEEKKRDLERAKKAHTEAREMYKRATGAWPE